MNQSSFIQPKKTAQIIGVLLALMFVVVFVSTAAAVQVGNDEVNFIEVRYDYPNPGQSTWYYEVISGAQPSISHINFKFGACIGAENILDEGTWGPTGDDLQSGQGDPKFGPDNSTNGDIVLKFDEGFNDNETRNYYFTLDGNYSVDNMLTIVSKGGPGFDSAFITGPNQDCAEEPATYSLGDTVWYDQDQDGIQDADELGVTGITASLYDNATCTGSPVDTAITNASGFYQFSDLLAGDYCVEFSDIPSGWSISPADQGGDDTADSDADNNGQITNISLSADDPTNDMGLYTTGSLGDEVICVTTGLGIPNISISLFEDFDGNGQPDGSAIATATTNIDGLYEFTNLEVALAGDNNNTTAYIVQVDTNDSDLGTCNVLESVEEYNPELDTDNPDDPDNDFEFSEAPPETGSITIVKEATPEDGTNFSFTASGSGFPSTDPPTFVASWGGSGSDNGQLNRPTDVVVDSSGNIFVVDQDNHRIQKFDSNGGYLDQWGSLGSSNGQFNKPQSIAIDGSGNIYVVDRFNHRIQKFDSSGGYLTQWGGLGGGNGQFFFPTGVAVDSSNNVYIVDQGNNRIQKFNSSGGYLTQWGSNGSGNGQFAFPQPIAVDSNDNVYVGDTQNHRVQKFDSSGNYLTQWGSNGSSDGQFEQPFGIVVDNQGNVYVGDTQNNRIQKFDSTGTFITKWGSLGFSDGQFFQPFGVTVDSNGNAYVTDLSNRVQKFEPAAGGGNVTFTLDDANPDDNDGVDQSITFDDLMVGDYDITEILPDGWTLDNIDCGKASTSDITNGVTVSLSAGEDITCTFENSEIQTYNLGDTVWYDQNQDGIQDGNEPGVSGITADLYDNATCSGSPVTSDTTDANGFYEFTDLLAGDYCVEFGNIPADWSISPADQTTDDADSDANSNGQITNISLSADDPTNDMGLYTTGSLGDEVICVTTGLGIPNISVSLFEDFDGNGQPDGSAIATATTNADGLYEFTNLEVALAGDNNNTTAYIVQVDTNDSDLGTCNVLESVDEYNPELDTDNPDDPDNDFEFSEQPPQFGNLEVTKVVDWNGVRVRNRTFEICIQGPSYPNGNEAGACQDINQDGGVLTWADLTLGDYEVTETVPSSNWTAEIDSSPVTVSDSPTATVTITNTHSAAAGLYITKAVPDGKGDPNNPDQAFSGRYGNGDRNIGPAPGSWKDGRTFGKSDLPASTWRVRETDIPANWTLEDITCESRDGTSTFGTFTPGTNFIDVELAAGDRVDCTVTNSYTPPPGDLAVTKIVDWNGVRVRNRTFEICIQGPSYPSGDEQDACQDVSQNGGDLTWTDLATGVYTVTETVPDSNWSAEIDSSPVTVASNLTSTVTITNTHTDPAGLYVTKDVPDGEGDPNNPDQAFSGRYGNGDRNIGHAPGSWKDGSTFGRSDLPAGSWLVREVDIPANWTLDDITCESRDGTSTFGTFTPGTNFIDVELAAGDRVDCTVTNSYEPPLGSITVIKSADPSDGTDFDFTLTKPDNSTLTATLDDDDGADPNNTNNVTFTLLPAGDYDITEVLPNGWALGSVDCGNATTNDITNGVTVSLAQGESVICTFNNIGPGSITVIKSADPSDGTDFDFTLTKPDNSTLTATIDDDDGTDPNNTNNVSFNLLAAGDYDITEALPNGWALGSVDCGNAVTNDIANGVTVSLAQGEDVTCTFNNVGPGSITVIKSAEPSDGTDFDFTLTKPDNSTLNATLDDDNGADPNNTNNVSFNLLPAGNYDITEALPNGWALGSVDCGNATTNDITNGVTVSLAQGEDVTCTFNNVGPGSITIIKSAEPSDGTDFDFTLTKPDNSTLNATLDDDNGADPNNTNNVSFNLLPAGNYDITEALPNGWALGSVDCGNAVTNDIANGVTVSLAQGEDVTCTFNNVGPGSITIIKSAEPSDGTDFDFTLTKPDNSTVTATIDDDTLDNTHINNFAVDNLPAGNYDITEALPIGWSLDSVECIGNTTFTNITNGITISLAQGEHATCIFNNTKLSMITLRKEVSQGDPNNPNQTFTLDIFKDNAVVAGLSTFKDGDEAFANNLLPGDYTVREILIPDGWSVENISCTSTNGNSIFETFVAGETTLDVDLAAGDVVTCTFTNRYEPQDGSITIVKEVVEGSTTSEFDFEIDFGNSVNSFVLTDGDSQTFSDLASGDYVINETFPIGENDDWEALEAEDIVCESTGGSTFEYLPFADESDTFGIKVTLAAGDDVTCTFKNTEIPATGSLEVTKFVSWYSVTPDESKTFEICIQGPSYPNGNEPGACQEADFDGGLLTWDDLELGDYTVSETNPGDEWGVFIMDSPATVVADETAEASVNNQYKVGDLFVYKINDLNGNGILDGEETFLSDWEITVYDSEQNFVGSAITNDNGQASFEFLLIGDYIVCETQQDGWVNTNDSNDVFEFNGKICQNQTVEEFSFFSVYFANQEEPEDLRLNLTAECVVGDTLFWRVTNNEDVDIDFTWSVYGDPQNGSGVAKANDRTYFTTQDVGGANTTKIFWDNPATDKDPDEKTKAHNNQPCVYHVDFAKEWTGGDAPDLDGVVLLTAESSLGTAECTSDDGALTCSYTTGDDLKVPFGETYTVSESTPEGWVTSEGTGTGFTGIAGFDLNALPDDLIYDIADDRFCESNPDASFPFNLEKFCTHTVENQREIKKISPVLECVAPIRGTEMYRAFFGYSNPNDFMVEIPVGSENKFNRDPQDQGQPTEFMPGRTPFFPDAAFSVDFDGNPLVWTLNGKTATASDNPVQRCHFYVEVDKEWTGADAPEHILLGLISASSTAGELTCDWDGTDLNCDADNLKVPVSIDTQGDFVGHYSVSEDGLPEGWNVLSGTGDFSVPNDYCEGKFCEHTVINEKEILELERLIPDCYDTENGQYRWRVRNPHEVEIPFTLTNPAGDVILAEGIAAPNGDTVVYTDETATTFPTILRVDGVEQPNGRKNPNVTACAPTTGKITIVKQIDWGRDVDNAPDTQFNFSGDLGGFTLGDGESYMMKLPAGSYDITEAFKYNWELGHVTCDSGDTRQISHGVRIDLEVGDDITCTFVNEPNCVEPRADLSATITWDGDMAMGHVTNDSDALCSWDVGMASYEKYNEVIDEQDIFDWTDGVNAPPGETIKMTIGKPACAVQIDVFFGEVLLSLDGQRYGHRLLAYQHLHQDGYCERPMDKVDGYVSADGAGLSEVTVTLTNAQADSFTLETTTNADGYYAFHDVPYGTYRVTISGDALNGMEIAEPSALVEVGTEVPAVANFNGDPATPTSVTVSAIGTTSSTSTMMITIIAAVLMLATIALWRRPDAETVR